MMQLIYLIGIVDDLKGFLVVTGILGVIASFIFTGICLVCIAEGNENSWIKSITKKVFFATLFSALLSVLIPSSKTIAAMCLIPAIASNEQIQNIGGNTLKILEEYSRQWLEEIVEDKQKKEQK